MTKVFKVIYKSRQTSYIAGESIKLELGHYPALAIIIDNEGVLKSVINLETVHEVTATDTLKEEQTLPAVDAGSGDAAQPAPKDGSP